MRRAERLRGNRRSATPPGPFSWATSSRIDVGADELDPVRQPSGGTVLVQFGRDGGVELTPALLELGQALALELVGDVLEVDAGGGQLLEHLARAVVIAADRVAGHVAMVEDRFQRGAGH